MSIESLFNTSATILTFTASTGSWGSVDSYTDGASVPCRLRALSGSEYRDGKIRGEATHKAYLPAGTAIGISDRIRINGIVFDIIPPIYDAGGGKGHHMEVTLKEHIG